MNVAKLSDYRKPHIEVVESRVAQLEDGFLRLANELLDATMCSGLPETELCIVMAVWRKTYGYSKKMDWISNEQLEAMIGKHLTHCSTAKNSLVRKKVLLQEGRKVGMNTNISEWETKNNGFCKTLAKPAKETLAEVANGPLQKLLTTKDNIQKTKDNTPKSPEGSVQVPQESPPEKPSVSKFTFNRDRFKDTWNCKAQKHGLPRIVSISTTTEKGIKRLYESHLKHCRETKRHPKDIDTFINGYIEFGYQPTPYAMGDNPAGKKYGVDTALTQRIVDQIISQEPQHG
ncbi:replication protein O [Erwinia phage vB_EhrS_49]|uniref:Replication protein O n=1 Tax=Erwinia phage vB_EhrS_49 TaxID=2283026 RepID=A0A4Y1NS23_9CAUD|nr:replication initiation O-like [Erwinia phage vB_EhrS_49]AXH43505.1 replication protein O [Erwinia phage vB_EhrS_49]